MEYLRFRRMIAPLVIEVLFWFGVVASIIAGIIVISLMRPTSPRDGIGRFRRSMAYSSSSLGHWLSVSTARS